MNGRARARLDFFLKPAPAPPAACRRAPVFQARESIAHMKSATLRHLRLAALSLCAIVMLAGCSPYGWPQKGFIRGYEYRYRVFEAGQSLPSTLEGPYDGDQLAQRFLPVGALNRAMEVLSQEGFVLWKIERIPGSTYYTFTFRRSRPMGFRPTLAPAEFTGVYQVQSPGDTSQYYALGPIYAGYTVVIFHGAEVPQVVDAKWDGKHLQSQCGDTHHEFMLSGDGLTLVHTQDRILSGGLERKVFRAQRVQTGKP